jgi:hypothetical protein
MEPNTRSSTQTARGTSVQLQSPKNPLRAWLHIITGKSKANQGNSYEKHTANLRELPHGQSCKSAKHTKSCEKHGGARKTARGVRKLQIKKRNRFCAKSYLIVKALIQKSVLPCERILSNLIRKYCSKSRNNYVISEMSMSVLCERFLARAR